MSAEAAALDAADGVMDGRHFGAPIVDSPPPHPRGYPGPPRTRGYPGPPPGYGPPHPGRFSPRRGPPPAAWDVDEASWGAPPVPPLPFRGRRFSFYPSQNGRPSVPVPVDAMSPRDPPPPPRWSGYNAAYPTAVAARPMRAATVVAAAPTPVVATAGATIVPTAARVVPSSLYGAPAYYTTNALNVNTAATVIAPTYTSATAGLATGYGGYGYGYGYGYSPVVNTTPYNLQSFNFGGPVLALPAAGGSTAVTATPVVAAAAPAVARTGATIVATPAAAMAATPIGGTVVAAPAATIMRGYGGFGGFGGFGYSSPYGASPFAASPFVTSPYAASPYAASPYTASPYTASPYAASPYTVSPYAAFSSPYNQVVLGI